jgi:hypothetical protein
MVTVGLARERWMPEDRVAMRIIQRHHGLLRAVPFQIPWHKQISRGVMATLASCLARQAGRVRVVLNERENVKLMA